MIRVEPYSAAMKTLWNEVASTARNGHFLFDRDFMDYHADRLRDCSAIVFDDDGAIALFPANRHGDSVYSHQGLPFGGLVMTEAATCEKMLAGFAGLCAHYKTAGARNLVCKPIPWIYHQRPADDDTYALFRAGARMVRCDATTAINLRNPKAMSRRRLRGARKACSHGVTLGESGRWADFWSVLTETLKLRHNVTPTHSVDEILLLAGRFPDRIRLFTAESDGAVVAGVVMFESACVAHAQYIAASPQGKALGALDGLLCMLVDRFSHKSFFNFGVSSEQGGWRLNTGLAGQKEEFGGNTVVHLWFEVALETAFENGV